MNWNVIFGGAAFGTCLGVFGAAINAIFQRRFERRKWYADFFIRPKIEALRALHAAVVACQIREFTLPDKIDSIRMSDEDRQIHYERSRSAYEELQRTSLLAGIYLESEDIAAVEDFKRYFYSSRFHGQTEDLALGKQAPLYDRYLKIESLLKTLLFPENVLAPLIRGRSQTNRSRGA